MSKKSRCFQQPVFDNVDGVAQGCHIGGFTSHRDLDRGVGRIRHHVEGNELQGALIERVVAQDQTAFHPWQQATFQDVSQNRG